MKNQLPSLIALVTLACCSCSSQPETLVRDGYDEAEMTAATQRAINEVDAFIAELNAGTSEDYAVKAPIEDNGEIEHFWLTDVSYSNGKFKGTIGNDPGMVTNVKIGQTWEVKKDEISDWMYMRDGKMHGNYTLRPLLATMPEAEADELRSILAAP